MSDRWTRHPRERHRGYLRVLEARDPATDPARLRELAYDHIPPVRLYVSTNPSCPPDVLEAMAHRDELRWYVLGNPALPASALWYVTDREWRRNFLFVGIYASFSHRERCYYHPNATEALKEELRAQGVLESLRRRSPQGRSVFKDGRRSYEPSI